MIIHPKTQQMLDAVLQQKPQALLISGARGSGKLFIARFIVQYFLGDKSYNDYPYMFQIDAAEDGSLALVRGIKDFLSRKTTGREALRRFVVINNAEKLSREAQNAMLKILEEPPSDTLIILTASDQTLLLSTILSRVFIITIFPIGHEQASALAEKYHITTQRLSSAYHVSGGNPGLLHSLLSEDDHSLSQAIAAAKEILQASPYQRLIKVEQLAKQKEGVDELLFALQKITKAVFVQSKDTKQANRLHHTRGNIAAARMALQHNGNTKLVLTKLFLEL